MLTDNLCAVYNDIYDTPLVPTKKECHKRMQVIIYFLQRMGINVSAFSYSFNWHENGPRSMLLQKDVNHCTGMVHIHPHYTEAALYAIRKLKSILIETRTPYSLEKWADCLMSLDYIKEYKCGYFEMRKGVIRKLEQLRPEFNDNDTNNFAYARLIELQY